MTLSIANVSFVATMGLLFLAGMAGCQMSSETSRVPPGLSGWHGAAHETQLAHHRAIKAGDSNSAPWEDVPEEFWAKPIRALKPLRVYYHSVNLVVAQRLSGEIEEGLYIQVPGSSYIPGPGLETDGFTFYASQEGVLRFKRRRGLRTSGST